MKLCPMNISHRGGIRLSLHRESGLKLFVSKLHTLKVKSLPTQGEWIEIPLNCFTVIVIPGLSLHRESGLKYTTPERVACIYSLSLHRESGLKCLSNQNNSLHGICLSLHRESGLKFFSKKFLQQFLQRLSLHRESGLKSKTSLHVLSHRCLSLHRESRLKSQVWTPYCVFIWSLPTQGEWIEIFFVNSL